jgi:hypothetical protein
MGINFPLGIIGSFGFLYIMLEIPMSTNHLSIIEQQVPFHLRSNFLPQKVPHLFLIFETLVYQYAGSFSSEYRGGDWNYYELSNGGFYMSLQSDDDFHVVIHNFCDGYLSANALGIVSSMCALYELANECNQAYLLSSFQLLKVYVCNHPESSEILRAFEFRGANHG